MRARANGACCVLGRRRAARRMASGYRGRYRRGVRIRSLLRGVGFGLVLGTVRTQRTVLDPAAPHRRYRGNGTLERRGHEGVRHARASCCVLGRVQ